MPCPQPHRDVIVGLAQRYKLPAVYYRRYFVVGGGLISYGINFKDQYLRAAGYVDRILRGEKPANLPVQAPTKYELVINLKTAKALGLTMLPMLLAPDRRGDRMRREWHDKGNQFVGDCRKKYNPWRYHDAQGASLFGCLRCQYQM